MTEARFPIERKPESAWIHLVLRDETRKRTGNRVVLFGSGTFVELQKGAEAIIGDEASAVFYEAGIKSGREGGETILMEWDERGEELMTKLGYLWDSQGLGWFSIMDAQLDSEEKEGFVRVSESFIAASYGTSKKPVCHFLSGYISGFLEKIWKTPMVCEEKICQSMEDYEFCEFHLERV
jgi:predicted hydrocarbon binding protein